MNELAIHDVYCAAYLGAMGVTLKRVERGNWPVFVFDDVGYKATVLLGIWQSNCATVNVSDYAKTMKAYRNLMFSNRQQNGVNNGNGTTA